MEKLGYLGLGVMGYGMASNLIDKHYDTVYGYDPVPESRERFAARGGCAVEDPHELYRTCDIIMMCLPTNAIVQATIEDIIATARPGTTIVDMGATAPHIIRELHAKAAEQGMYLLDAPVSGGSAGAEAGTLAIMCGGEPEVFEHVLPYLQMMGGAITHVGGPGCGDVAKLANNMIVNTGLLTIGEAFAFAKKAGVDARTLYAAMKGGAAESAILNLRASMIFERRFTPPTARATIGYKDAVNALDMAKELGVELPLTEMLANRYQWMAEHGIGEEDHSAIIKYYEDSMGVTIE